MNAGHRVKINAPLTERKDDVVSVEADQKNVKSFANRLFLLEIQVLTDPRQEIDITDRNRDHKADRDHRDHLFEGGADHNRRQDEEIMTAGHTQDGLHRTKTEPIGQILEIDSKIDNDLQNVVTQRIDTTVR